MLTCFICNDILFLIKKEDDIFTQGMVTTLYKQGGFYEVSKPIYTGSNWFCHN
jgi:hypothetical protein